jgi:hypothetical protein
MTRPITLTTTVRNQATLSLLLKNTDRLVSAGLLDSLRVIDATPDEAGTERLRSMIPMDGESRTRIVAPDVEELKRVDPQAHVFSGMTGYSYKATTLRLLPGGPGVNVMMRGTKGAYILASSPTRGGGLVEIGLEKNRCFARFGRGGGTPVAVLDVPGVASGLGWRAMELSLDFEKRLSIQLDTGEVMVVPLRVEAPELIISVSAPSSGVSDFVIVNVTTHVVERLGKINRNYVSYFSSSPEPVQGVEFISDVDLVYIDEAGWRRLINDEATPLVLGDPAHCVVLRRIGVLKESSSSTQVHRSFLDRSRHVIDRINELVDRDIPIASVTNSKFSRRDAIETLLPPALICCLQGNSLSDRAILERYETFFEEGPVGEKLAVAVHDVLAHFDSLLNSTGAEEFLLELLEALPREKQEFLLNALKKKLS